MDRSRRYTLENLMTMSSTSDVSLEEKINNRQRDFENIKEIKRQTAEIADRMRTLAVKLEDVTDDSKTVQLVLNNMQEVMNGLRMAALPLAKIEGDGITDDASVLPQRVIRVRLDNPEDEDEAEDPIALETSQISDE